MVTAVTLVYLLILLFTIGRILLDTHSVPKTLAYLLLVVTVPGIGIIFHYSVGINYRHHRSLSVMERAQRALDADYLGHVQDETNNLLAAHGE